MVEGPDPDGSDWLDVVGTECQVGEYGGSEVNLWLQRRYKITVSLRNHNVPHDMDAHRE